MAAARNPYDLEEKKVTGPAQKRAAKTYTDEEKKELLVGYILIRPQYWPYIKYATHIRYVTKSGDFRPGGFVKKNPFDVKPTDSLVEKRFIKLASGFNAGAANFIAAYEDLEAVYIKPSAEILEIRAALEEVTTKLNSNNHKLLDGLKKMDAKIKTLAS